MSLGRDVRFALLCALTGSFAMSAPGEVTAPAHYVISGAVVDARTGAPVPHAHLQATLLDLAQRSNVATDAPGGRTGASGPAGQIRLNGQTSAGNGGRTQTNRSVVRDNPTVDADVHGHFLLAVPSAGMWRLTATGHGYRSQVFHQQGGGYGAAVVLTEAAPTYSLSFAIQPDALLEGLVRDEAGEPVERAQVFVEWLPQQTFAEIPATPRQVAGGATDDRGHYEVSGLAAGLYRVRVQAIPWYAAGAAGGRFGRQLVNANPAASADPSLDLVYPATWYPAATDPTGAEILPLSAGEIRQADIQLNAVAAVHLQVPVPVQQTAQPNGGSRSFQPGVVFLRVSDNGYDFASGGMQQGDASSVESGSLSPGLYDIRSGSGFNGPMQPEEEVREIEVRPGMSGTISLADAISLVHVGVSFEGAPENSIRQMSLVNKETGRRITATSGAGRRNRQPKPGEADSSSEEPASKAPEIQAAVPPGSYDLYLSNTPAYVLSVEATGAKATGRTVEISGGAPHLLVHVATGRAAVHGVIQASAKPLLGAMVVLVPATLGQPGDLDRTYLDESNTDGSFFLDNVIPGKYILIAIDRGWDVKWREPATLVRYLEHGVPLELTPGANVNETIDAQLP